MDKAHKFATSTIDLYPKNNSAPFPCPEKQAQKTGLQYTKRVLCYAVLSTA